MTSKKYTFGKTMQRDLKKTPYSIGKNVDGEWIYWIPQYYKVQKNFPQLRFSGYIVDDNGISCKCYLSKVKLR